MSEAEAPRNYSNNRTVCCGGCMQKVRQQLLLITKSAYIITPYVTSLCKSTDHWLLLNWSCDISGSRASTMAMLASGSHSLGSINPWSSNDTLLGIRLGDPQSGLVLARRQGLLPHHVLESSHHQEQVPGVWFLLPESKRRVRELFWSHIYSLAWRTLRCI